MTDRVTFEYTASRLMALREGDDTSRWLAGDAVCEFLGSAGSERSDAEDVSYTLDLLAAHSGFERGGLRERSHCSRFYPAGRRNWDVSWSIWNRARRVGDLDQACSFVAWAEKANATVARFDRALARWKQIKGLTCKQDQTEFTLPVGHLSGYGPVVYLPPERKWGERVRVRAA